MIIIIIIMLKNALSFSSCYRLNVIQLLLYHFAGETFVETSNICQLKVMSPGTGISAPRLSICSHLCLELGAECDGYVYDSKKSLCKLTGPNGKPIADLNVQVGFIRQSVSKSYATQLYPGL